MSSTCGERSSLGVHASTMRLASGVAASAVLDFVTNYARIAECLNVCDSKSSLESCSTLQLNSEFGLESVRIELGKVEEICRMNRFFRRGAEAHAGLIVP